MSLLGAIAIGTGISYVLNYMLKAKYNNNIQTILAENGYKIKKDGICAYKRNVTGLTIKDLVPIYNLGASSNRGAFLQKQAKIDKETKQSVLLEDLKSQGLVEKNDPLEQALLDNNKKYGKSNRAMVRWWRIREALGMERLSDKAKAKAAKLVKSKSQAVQQAQQQAQRTNANVVRPATQTPQRQQQPQRTSVIRPSSSTGNQTQQPQRTSVIRPSSLTGNQIQQPQRTSVIRPSSLTGNTPQMPQRRSVLRPGQEDARREEISKVSAEIERLKRYKRSLEAISSADEETLAMLDKYGLGLEPRTATRENQTGRRI